MIRVNLLSAETQREVLPVAPPNPALQGGVAVLLVLLAVAGHYVWLIHRARSLDRSLQAAQAQAVHLAIVQQQYNQMEQTAAGLRQRLNMIQTLGRAPANPAPVLAVLQQTVDLAPDLWLQQVEGKDSALTIAGGSGTLTRLADFLASLRGSGWFVTLEIRDSTEPTGGGPGGPYDFNLNGKLSPQPPAAAAGPAQPANLQTAPAPPAPAAPAAAAAPRN